MSCLRIFLVLAALLCDSGSASAACCENWNGDCGLIENSTICTGYSDCKSSGGTCSNSVCTDFTVTDCDGSHGYGDKKIWCKWSTTCVDATGVCGDWSHNTSYCSYAYDNTGSLCFLEGSICRKKECKDFSSVSNCDSARDIGGDGKQCKWDGSNCVAAAQCSDYSSSSCAYHSFGGVPCFDASGTCRPGTCGDITSQSMCDSYGKCYWTSDNKCTDFTACTQTSNSTKCDRATVGSSKCYYSDTCKVASGCTDCATETCCDNYDNLSCKWGSATKCTPLVCSEYTTDSSCNAYCYPLSSCPATGDSSSTVFVPTLLLALLLILFW